MLNVFDEANESLGELLHLVECFEDVNATWKGMRGEEEEERVIMMVMCVMISLTFT